MWMIANKWNLTKSRHRAELESRMKQQQFPVFPDLWTGKTAVGFPRQLLYLLHGITGLQILNVYL
jgi:hypothetical protein